MPLRTLELPGHAPALRQKRCARFRYCAPERRYRSHRTSIDEALASSTAPDTDFTAKLVDVYPPSKDFPAGFDLGVEDGIIRARYRNSLEHPEPMKPGGVYQISIDMYPTAMILKKGHRIRVDISSSNFPRFDVNPNTGEPLNDNRRSATAVNTIYDDDRHPSQIVLPIVPAG